MKKNLKFVIGGLLILAVVIWIFGSISSKNLTYYYTPSEVAAKYASLEGTTVRVMGMVEKNSIDWIPRETRLTFKMTDDHQHFVTVSYQGAKPDMFKEGQGVVVEGKFNAPGEFTADTLLVKHSEEYKVDPKTHKKEDYYQSLE